MRLSRLSSSWEWVLLFESTVSLVWSTTVHIIFLETYRQVSYFNLCYFFLMVLQNFRIFVLILQHIALAILLFLLVIWHGLGKFLQLMYQKKTWSLLIVFLFSFSLNLTFFRSLKRILGLFGQKTSSKVSQSFHFNIETSSPVIIKFQLPRSHVYVMFL